MGHNELHYYARRSLLSTLNQDSHQYDAMRLNETPATIHRRGLLSSRFACKPDSEVRKQPHGIGQWGRSCSITSKRWYNCTSAVCCAARASRIRPTLFTKHSIGHSREPTMASSSWHGHCAKPLLSSKQRFFKGRKQLRKFKTGKMRTRSCATLAQITEESDREPPQNRHRSVDSPPPPTTCPEKCNWSNKTLLVTKTSRRKKII